MFVAIAIRREAAGMHVARAPDFRGCEIRDRNAGVALARLRLAIETALAELQLDGKPVPAPKPLAEWQKDAGHRGWRWLEVHINDEQIAAVARHQYGRPPCGP